MRENVRKFKIKLYWTEEDKLYIAEIPELKGFFCRRKD